MLRAVLIVLTAGLVGLGATAHAAVHAVDPLPRALPASFAGISVETDLVTEWFHGGCRSPVRSALAMLGRPEIRVGGNSQDRLWPTAALPPGQHQVARGDYFHALHCLSAIRSPLLLGLNLLGRDPKATGDILAAVGGIIDRDLLTVAIGNEPNLYGSRLPEPGDYAGYLSLYGNTVSELRSRFESYLPPIAGPDPATWRWTEQTAQFVSDVRPAQVDEHVYGLNGCRQAPGTPGYPTVGQLLSPLTSEVLVNHLAPVIIAARAAGIPAQISEANSVACSGVKGVSDHPAAGLWGMSLLGAAARAGFSRVEIHSSRGVYDPFVFQHGRLAFRPIWIAMLVADQLWPAGSRPMHLHGAIDRGLGAWIARRPGGTLAAMVVNYDRRRAHTFALRTTRRHATVGRVLPSGTHALTLDGRRLGWARGQPHWSGRRRLEHPRVSHEQVKVRLAPESGAWLTVAR